MGNTYAYVRNDLDDTYGILELQDKMLEIMVYLDQFCSEHQIRYFLMGGSALGAIRHRGFIPWDDDLDIFMPWEDYEKFAKLCETDLDKSRFYFQKGNTDELPYFFSKLRRNGTACVEEVQKNRKNVHQGIFVDIMCLNQAAPDGLKRKVQFGAAALLRASALSRLPDYQANSRWKRAVILFSKWAVRGPVKAALLREVTKYNGKALPDVAHVFGRAAYQNAYYPARLFESQRYVPFEQVMLAVPNGVEEYLALRYGNDYMQLPSEETKSQYPSHTTIWSTTKDYTQLLP